MLRKVLIVDNDPNTCRLLSALFGAKGYNPTVIHNGRDAVKCVEIDKPDIVIMTALPEMDGWEMYRRMRARSDVPVLFLTNSNDGGSVIRPRSSDIFEAMPESFDPEELLARTESLLIKSSSSNIRYGQGITGIEHRPTVSVIIPTLNEAENLPHVLPILPLDMIDEVILVDGRSTDGTVQVAKKLLPWIKVILEEKRGKGVALRAGYHAAKGDILIVMDADGSHNPREIPRFIHLLMEGSDFAKGSRFAPGGGTTDMPRLRQLGNRFFVLLINTLFNVHFTDLCYGYHAFWRYCLDIIALEDVDGFEIDTAIYLRTLQQHLRLTEVPSFEGYRFRGVGKLRTFPDGWRVLKTIVRETKRNYLSPSKEPYEGFRFHRQEGITRPIIPVVKDTKS